MRRVLKPSGRLVIVVTREGAVGKCLQLAWRIHCMSVPRIRERLREADLALEHEESLSGAWWVARRSQACIATHVRKPTDSPPPRGGLEMNPHARPEAGGDNAENRASGRCG